MKDFSAFDKMALFVLLLVSVILLFLIIPAAFRNEPLKVESAAMVEGIIKDLIKLIYMYFGYIISQKTNKL